MAPSDWVRRWTPLLQPASAVLDLACGSGRHTRWFAEAGHRVTAVDRDASLLAALAPIARTHVADLEADAWPLADERFDAVVVTHYLWRPLVSALLAAVAPGGLLIYETFSLAQAAIGRPRRPEFLLRPGELLEWMHAPDFRGASSTDVPAATSDWHVIAFEQGRMPAHDLTAECEVQRIVARRGAPTPERPDHLGSAR